MDAHSLPDGAQSTSHSEPQLARRSTGLARHGERVNSSSTAGRKTRRRRSSEKGSCSEKGRGRREEESCTPGGNSCFSSQGPCRHDRLEPSSCIFCLYFLHIHTHTRLRWRGWPRWSRESYIESWKWYRQGNYSRLRQRSWPRLSHSPSHDTSTRTKDMNDQPLDSTPSQN